jgi:hypothetical protein
MEWLGFCLFVGLAHPHALSVAKEGGKGLFVD